MPVSSPTYLSHNRMIIGRTAFFSRSLSRALSAMARAVISGYFALSISKRLSAISSVVRTNRSTRPSSSSPRPAASATGSRVGKGGGLVAGPDPGARPSLRGRPPLFLPVDDIPPAPGAVGPDPLLKLLSAPASRPFFPASSAGAMLPLIPGPSFMAQSAPEWISFLAWGEFSTRGFPLRGFRCVP